MLTRDQQHGLVLASLPGTSDHGYLPRVGFLFHLHATAPGKDLLAAIPSATRSKIISQLELKRFTAATFCTPSELKNHLSDCAKHKLVFDRSEYVIGVNCVANCISMGTSQPLAAVWITSLVVDLPDEDLPKFGEEVLQAVGAMESRLQKVMQSLSLKHGYAMERAKVFIEEHFHDEIAVRDYYRSIGMSSSWFRHLFREKYGVAPLTYRWQLLHERAC